GQAVVRPGDCDAGWQDRRRGTDRAGAVRTGRAIHPRPARRDPASSGVTMARKVRRQASKKKAPATKSKTSRKKAAARSAASRTKAKATKPSAARDPLDAFIDAATLSLGLTCDPAWLPAIKMNLEVILHQAALVDEFALPDETEPAPVFEA